jgi:hypothetical protein
MTKLMGQYPCNNIFIKCTCPATHYDKPDKTRDPDGHCIKSESENKETDLFILKQRERIID